MIEPNGDGLSVSGWGAALKANGRDVMLLLVLLAGFASNGFILWSGLHELNAMLIASRVAQYQEHADIRRDGQETACVLMLDQSDRLRAIIDPLGICHYARSVARAKGMFP